MNLPRLELGLHHQFSPLCSQHQEWSCGTHQYALPQFYHLASWRCRAFVSILEGVEPLASDLVMLSFSNFIQITITLCAFFRLTFLFFFENVFDNLFFICETSRNLCWTRSSLILIRHRPELFFPLNLFMLNFVAVMSSRFMNQC